MHDDVLVGEFTHQAESFNRAAVANSPAIIGELLRLADPRRDERWLDAGCGPGIVSRALAPLVADVCGVDATEAMVEVARREAGAAGVSNVTFGVGDATALGAPNGSFDAAVSRFVIHHMPAPIRLAAELARVVRAGGKVVLVDHVADDSDVSAYAWSQEIERLRDPSHWATLAPSALRALGTRAGLRLSAERVLAVEVDFDEWLSRGSGASAAATLIEHVLGERPAGTACLRIGERAGHRTLGLRMWLSCWSVP